MGPLPLRLEDVPERLRALRATAGDPSYAEIARRVTSQRAGQGASAIVARATVYDCFRNGRRRFDIELVIAIVRALAREETTVREWSSALAVLGHRANAAALVSVTDTVPAMTAPFVGRRRELARLVADTGAHWIHAMPGAGKSTLAVHAARTAISSGAVSGVIIADLRGYSAAGPPADAQAVTRAALRLLGENSTVLSASAASRLLRDRLRERQVMLVLDDAASVDQVHRIVPHPSGMSVIVTSRIVPDTTKFAVSELSLFAPYESLALLDAIAGRAAIESDLTSAEALLQLTEHQPLAVSITAARVAARDAWTLAEHLELARARRANLRLDEPVARSLDLTCQLLSEPSQRLLRALAHYPVALLDRQSVDAIAGENVSDIDAALAELEQHSMIVTRASGRLQMHELVRIHAVDLGWELDPSSQRLAAAERLRQSLFDRAWSAHRIRNESRSARGRAPRHPVSPVDFSSDEADAFFNESLDLLLHVALNTTDGTAPGTANHLAETVDDALHRAGRAEDALTLFTAALRSARDRGDAEGELRALVDLGATLTLVGRVAESEGVLANIDSGIAGWATEAPLIHNALGTSLLSQGRFGEARASFDAGIAAASDIGDLWREGLLWNSIALLHLHEGELEECRTALARSIEISKSCGDLGAAARGRVNLAKLLHDLGDNVSAESEARLALTEMESLGYVPGIVVAYSNLSAAVCALDRYEDAAALAESGLTVAREAGMRQSELELLRTLGSARLGAGDIAEARLVFDDARRLADSLGDRLGAAACAEDLGDCARADGDMVEARGLWEQAEASYESAGSAYADGVRVKLAALPSRSHRVQPFAR